MFLTTRLIIEIFVFLVIFVIDTLSTQILYALSGLKLFSDRQKIGNKLETTLFISDNVLIVTMLLLVTLLLKVKNQKDKEVN